MENKKDSPYIWAVGLEKIPSQSPQAMGVDRNFVGLGVLREKTCGKTKEYEEICGKYEEIFGKYEEMCAFLSVSFYPLCKPRNAKKGMKQDLYFLFVETL